MVGPDLDFEMKTLKRVPQKQILGFLNEPSHFKLVLFPKQYIIGKEFKALYRFQIQGEIRNMSPRKKQRFFCKKGGFRIWHLSLSPLSLSFSSLSPISRYFSGNNDFSILLSITTCLCIFALSSSSSMSPTYRSQSWLKLFHLNPTWKADLWFHLKAWSFSCWSLSSSKLRYFINSS